MLHNLRAQPSPARILPRPEEEYKEAFLAIAKGSRLTLLGRTSVFPE